MQRKTKLTKAEFSKPMHGTWSLEETKELVKIRVEAETDANMFIWNRVASKLEYMGYNHSPMECNIKWTHLVKQFQEMVEADPNLPIDKHYLSFYAMKSNTENEMLNVLLPKPSEGGRSGLKRKAVALVSDDENEFGSLKRKTIEHPENVKSNDGSGNSSKEITLASLMAKMEEYDRKIEKRDAYIFTLLQNIVSMNSKAEVRDASIVKALHTMVTGNKFFNTKVGKKVANMTAGEGNVAEAEAETSITSNNKFFNFL